MVIEIDPEYLYRYSSNRNFVITALNGRVYKVLNRCFPVVVVWVEEAEVDCPVLPILHPYFCQ